MRPCVVLDKSRWRVSGSTLNTCVGEMSNAAGERVQCNLVARGAQGTLETCLLYAMWLTHRGANQTVFLSLSLITKCNEVSLHVELFCCTLLMRTVTSVVGGLELWQTAVLKHLLQPPQGMKSESEFGTSR